MSNAAIQMTVHSFPSVAIFDDRDKGKWHEANGRTDLGAFLYVKLQHTPAFWAYAGPYSTHVDKELERELTSEHGDSIAWHGVRNKAGRPIMGRQETSRHCRIEVELDPAQLRHVAFRTREKLAKQNYRGFAYEEDIFGFIQENIYANDRRFGPDESLWFARTGGRWTLVDHDIGTWSNVEPKSIRYLFQCRCRRRIAAMDSEKLMPVLDQLRDHGLKKISVGELEKLTR